ncbi:SH3 and PX domain-containing protein 2A-like isoform X2 [Saccostrea echinata]|uniref:SH3 and PX domain-containing protein 2A-like isoform X2 n=1 Tax=Saccostrea echinata TaxID=191078 RepID=UPI002A82CA69|nr:SH3 and PX domain-containing protein 2A-like isoform X2 [Saccostrea echinata]
MDINLDNLEVLSENSDSDYIIMSNVSREPPVIEGEDTPSLFSMLMEFIWTYSCTLCRRKKKATFDTASKISEPRLGEQYRAIADYTKEDKWDLNLKAGTEVEVIEKTESGWWFVHVQDQQGWVPSTYLKRADGIKEELSERARPGEEEQYICTDDYYPSNSDELPLEKGTVVEVIEKNLDGWWWIRQKGKEGWAPATYMMKAEKAHMERVARASGVQIVGGLQDISDLMQDNGDDSWDDEPDPPPHPTKPYLSKKSLSLERGGSIRPPPRQNSIKNIKIDIKPPKQKKTQYVTIADFTDTVGDGISFSKGESVEVKQKTADGWWFVRIGNNEGWAPSTYIEGREMGDIQEDYVPNDENYSEVAIDSDDEEDYEHPDSMIRNNEYEEVKYEVPVNNNGEGEKPNFVFSKQPNLPKPPDLVKEKLDSVRPLSQAELRVRKNPNAIKRPTSKPPPPPIGFVANRDSSPKPPPVDRSSLAAALKNKLEARVSEEVSKPDLEAKSSSSSSDSDKKPILPPKLPMRPDKTERSFPEPSVPTQVSRERIHSDGGNNLAEILKAKFESRKTTTEENENTDSSIFNTFPKKTGVQISQLPLCQAKSNPDFSNKTVPKQEKPGLPPKFDKPAIHLKPTKNESAHKRLSMQEESSELANALQARLRRQSNVEVTSSQHYSAVEKPKKSFPSKPIVPEKTISEDKTPILPPKIDVNKTGGKEDSRTAVTKTNKTDKSFQPGWKKESCKPKSKPPVLAKPKKPVLPKNEVKDSKNEGGSPQSLVKSGFAKDLASKLSSNLGKQDTNTDFKPAIPKKSPIVQKIYGAKLEDSDQGKTSSKSSVSQQSYKTIARYQADGNGEVSFEEGVELEVLRKTEGWWLVRVGTSEGWAPATYIEPCGCGPRSPSPVCDSGFTSPEEGSNSVSSVKYRTCAEFIPESDTELGFKEGWVVEVLDSSEDDWWYARVDGREGWVPAEYLEEV